MEKERLIVYKDFYGAKKHLYRDELGWQDWHRDDARTPVSRRVFLYYAEEIGMNIQFFHIKSDRFIGIKSDSRPISVYEMPVDKTKDSPRYFQCNRHVFLNSLRIGVFETAEDLWNSFTIDGASFEDVLENSCIYSIM